MELVQWLKLESAWQVNHVRTKHLIWYLIWFTNVHCFFPRRCISGIGPFLWYVNRYTVLYHFWYIYNISARIQSPSFHSGSITCCILGSKNERSKIHLIYDKILYIHDIYVVYLYILTSIYINNIVIVIVCWSPGQPLTTCGQRPVEAFGLLSSSALLQRESTGLGEIGGVAENWTFWWQIWAGDEFSWQEWKFFIVFYFF